MNKLLIILCLGFGLFSFQQVSAQCPSGEENMNIINDTGCSIDYVIHLSNGTVINKTLAANTSYSQCIGTSVYATDMNVDVSGGGSVNLTAVSPDQNGALCSTPSPLTSFHARSTGWAGPSVVECQVTEI